MPKSRLPFLGVDTKNLRTTSSPMATPTKGKACDSPVHQAFMSELRAEKLAQSPLRSPQPPLSPVQRRVLTEVEEEICGPDSVPEVDDIPLSEEELQLLEDIEGLENAIHQEEEEPLPLLHPADISEPSARSGNRGLSYVQPYHKPAPAYVTPACLTTTSQESFSSNRSQCLAPTTGLSFVNGPSGLSFVNENSGLSFVNENSGLSFVNGKSGISFVAPTPQPGPPPPGPLSTHAELPPTHSILMQPFRSSSPVRLHSPPRPSLMSSAPANGMAATAASGTAAWLHHLGRLRHTGL